MMVRAEAGGGEGLRLRAGLFPFKPPTRLGLLGVKLGSNFDKERSGPLYLKISWLSLVSFDMNLHI